MRDDFEPMVKSVLAKRVGLLCSNPDCNRLTSGPQINPKKAISIGVAAHITAASPKGPRYDPNITSQERRDIQNGIWLCQNCAKMIDNDSARYTIELLVEWKNQAEQHAKAKLEGALVNKISEAERQDVELLRFYSTCLDRPAFQDPFEREGRIEAFDRAIEDTITAINTGCLRSRDGVILAQSKGKSFLSNSAWRTKLDTIVDLLRAIRSRYSLAIQCDQIRIVYEKDNIESYYLSDAGLATWMNNTKFELMQIFAELCQEAGIQPLSSSYKKWRY